MSVLLLSLSSTVNATKRFGVDSVDGCIVTTSMGMKSLINLKTINALSYKKHAADKFEIGLTYGGKTNYSGGITEEMFEKIKDAYLKCIK